MLTAGLGGGARHGCVALAQDSGLLSVCAQERVTRARGAGFNSSGLPDEALDLLLERLGRSRRDVARYVIADSPYRRTGEARTERLDHHLAHACAAYLSSPFATATILVCDDEGPGVSVWRGRGPDLTRLDWPWNGPGFADVYSRCARAFGFVHETGAQHFEALARLEPDVARGAFASLFSYCDGRLQVHPTLEAIIEKQLPHDRDAGSTGRARAASALQAELGDLFLQLLVDVRRMTGDEDLCLGGSFFYHSSINALARSSGLFGRVFVPVDPGNAGLAVGTALHAASSTPTAVSPFLGPAYSAQEIKEVLDNCKLHYAWELEEHAIGEAVAALMAGRLVGWFDGAMEWGPRALGARCILANPQAPYVLENLNRFLKRREPWRGYAVSGLEEAVGTYFDGPAAAPFMECDYRPRDPGLFRHMLPRPAAAIRVQTVGRAAPLRFRRLLEAFAQTSGLPFLINTSFNGFHEPIVCSPRDAVRVFYGSGIDLLVVDRFVLNK